MTDQAMPAGWYDDPSKVGELRYHDGAQWTEHITIDGVQTTAPFSQPPTFTMSRLAQWRSEDEKPLDVVGRNGVIGHFVTTLDGAPGYRFDDADGEAVVSVVKPGLKKQVEVSGPSGDILATIAKVGRLRSRYDIARSTDSSKATVRLSSSDNDTWDLQIGDTAVATITRTMSATADALNFAAVTYSATLTGALDDDMERVFLVIPLAIDILDTQAL